MLIQVLLALSITAFADSSAKPSDYYSCKSAEDCAPNRSCHPDEAINKKYASTEAVMCTMDCRTILDCGRGEIKCENSKCVVVDKRASK